MFCVSATVLVVACFAALQSSLALVSPSAPQTVQVELSKLGEEANNKIEAVDTSAPWIQHHIVVRFIKSLS